ncbi:MAG TPA: crosslink repair DNA glycosylase YcaQ family protein [Gaiellaceae bacterium]|nr:crosslink repair DNA glycosylase YcaQ family protein [Gaiellaceae bacterium]
MAVHRLSKAEARRIAIRAQLLDANRPTDLLELVSHLTFLQLDPTAAIAPSADLVAWTRMGAAYRPEQLTEALELDRTLYEVRAYVRPTADLGLYLESMAAWPYAKDDKRYSPPPGPIAQRWLEKNESFRQDVLRRLRESGPLMSRDIHDTSVVPWQSSGWTGNRNVTQMLEFLNSRGEVAIAGRSGRQRLWDFAERVYPRVKPVPLAKARRALAERRIRWLGISRLEVIGVSGERYHEVVHGEPAEIEGTRGEWVVDPAALGQDFEGRTALLSPFDRLIHDRVRAQELFDFEYYLEMYKPAAKRRWGYFALPILHGDRLVGKLDATADRKASALRVHAIHDDVRFTRPIVKGVRAELDNLASWLGLEDVVLPTSD